MKGAILLLFLLGLEVWTACAGTAPDKRNIRLAPPHDSRARGETTTLVLAPLLRVDRGAYDCERVIYGEQIVRHPSHLG